MSFCLFSIIGLKVTASGPVNPPQNQFSDLTIANVQFSISTGVMEDFVKVLNGSNINDVNINRS